MTKAKAEKLKNQLEFYSNKEGKEFEIEIADDKSLIVKEYLNSNVLTEMKYMIAFANAKKVKLTIEVFGNLPCYFLI